MYVCTVCISIEYKYIGAYAKWKYVCNGTCALRTARVCVFKLVKTNIQVYKFIYKLRYAANMLRVFVFVVFFRLHAVYAHAFHTT